MKRGTHGTVKIGIAAVKVTSRTEIVRAVSVTISTGTQPGGIYANDNPKSTGYPRLFLIYHSRVKRGTHGIAGISKGVVKSTR